MRNLSIIETLRTRIDPNSESSSPSNGSDPKLIKGTRSNAQFLEFLNSQFTKADNARKPLERKWYENTCFYFGRQWVHYIGAGPLERFYEPPVPKWRVRLVNNKIKPAIRKELSKITQEKPTGFVIPKTSDEQDIAAARGGDAIFEALWRDLGMNKVLRRSVFWSVICGTGFIRDNYNPTEIDHYGQPGKIVANSIKPFNIWVSDPQEEELEDQAFFIQGMVKDPDWVESTYGQKVEPDSNIGTGILENKFNSLTGLNVEERTKVFVKEMWMKPNGKYPNGLIAVWGNDVLLYVNEQGWPTLHRDYPLAKIEHIPTGTFYGESIIRDLIPLQKEYNRTRSQIVESKNRMAKPQLIAQKGSVDPNRITSEPGLIIFYELGFQPPSPLPMQNMPSYVFNHMDLLQRDFDDISSQHEVTKGRTPSGVTAATAISFLQEQDDSVLAPTISSVEEAVQKTARHFLNYVQQYWDAPRQIRITGINGQFEAFSFTQSSLNGNTDFYVEAGSATPRSRAAKQAFIMEIGQMGWIPPDKALRYLDMAETGRLHEEMQVDVRHVQRENLRMANGQQVPVNKYDNDLVHIEHHDLYRKTQSYEILDPRIKQVFEMHDAMHKMQVAAKMGIFSFDGMNAIQPGDPRLDVLVSSGPQALGLGMGAPVGEEGGEQNAIQPGPSQ